jgi:hypothetical protein
LGRREKLERGRWRKGGYWWFTIVRLERRKREIVFTLYIRATLTYCGNEYENHMSQSNLMLRISGTLMRDLIEPSS